MPRWTLKFKENPPNLLDGQFIVSPDLYIYVYLIFFFFFFFDIKFTLKFKLKLFQSWTQSNLGL